MFNLFTEWWLRLSCDILVNGNKLLLWNLTIITWKVFENSSYAWKNLIWKLGVREIKEILCTALIFGGEWLYNKKFKRYNFSFFASYVISNLQHLYRHLAQNLSKWHSVDQMSRYWITSRQTAASPSVSSTSCLSSLMSSLWWWLFPIWFSVGCGSGHRAMLQAWRIGYGTRDITPDGFLRCCLLHYR